jgi:hypothetical protein
MRHRSHGHQRVACEELLHQMLVGLRMGHLLRGEGLRQRTQVLQTYRDVQLAHPRKGSHQLSRPLLLEHHQSLAQEPTPPRRSQRVEDQTDSRLPSVPQECLQVQIQKTKICALGRINESTSHALHGRHWHGCHQWHLQEKLQLHPSAQVILAEDPGSSNNI